MVVMGAFARVASTILNETGHFKPDVIERQLAHCERNEVKGAHTTAPSTCQSVSA